MSDDPILPIFRKLNTIEAIASELPAIGRRSELKAKVHEIYLLLDEARKAAMNMEKEIISLKYEYPAQRFERPKDLRR